MVRRPTKHNGGGVGCWSGRGDVCRVLNSGSLYRVPYETVAYECLILMVSEWLGRIYCCGAN